MPASSPPVAPAVESDIALATRRSIKKNFPLGSIMSKGGNNPITLHSSDDHVFAAMWSLIGETMVVTVELSRTTKEAIATLVSQRNSCPVCITAHFMMEAAASNVEHSKDKMKNKDKMETERERSIHEESLDYAGLILDSLNNEDELGDDLETYTDDLSKCQKRFPNLTETQKAECALVVLLFSHVNRVVSVLLGEEMSTAMFGVPRAAARAMENRGVVKVMNRFMAPLMAGAFQNKYTLGFTSSLFSDANNMNVGQQPLPSNLQGVLLAGMERGFAINRLIRWVDQFETKKLIGSSGLLPRRLIRFLDDPPTCVMCSGPKQVYEWANADEELETRMRVAMRGPLKESHKAIVKLLLLATLAPQTAYKSNHWATVVEHVGETTARTIVIWWSLRHTFKHAKGLDNEIDNDSMLKLLKHELDG